MHPKRPANENKHGSRGRSFVRSLRITFAKPPFSWVSSRVTKRTAFVAPISHPTLRSGGPSGTFFTVGCRALKSHESP